MIVPFYKHFTPTEFLGCDLTRNFYMHPPELFLDLGGKCYVINRKSMILEVKNKMITSSISTRGQLFIP